jgi:glycosyltransferase involved in cell wall biosynthesis
LATIQASRAELAGPIAEVIKSLPSGKILLSVVIAVFNSERSVEATVERTVKYLGDLGISFELLLVNDGSHDRSWQKIRVLAENDARITAVNLLKNYGQHAALMCGIRRSNGMFVMTMDDDLQNPPEEIAKLLNRIGEGFDVVFAKFRVKQHNLVRRMGSRLIGELNRRIFHKPDDITLSNFRIFTRAVADRMCNYRTAYPYIQGLLLMFSSKVGNVQTEHSPRYDGVSNYTLVRILKLVGCLLFNYSSFPLKALTTLGFCISFVSFIAGFFYVVKALLVGSKVAGWTSVFAVMSFLNGFIIVMLGVVGEYIARLLNQVSVDQCYHIQDVVSHEPN